MLPLSPTNPALLVFPTLLAWITAALLVRFAGGDPTPARRYASLDGLRGFLSLGVFFGHSVVWYYFSRTQRWDAPSSLYGYLAQYSVVMFFMLTGFLFSIKLLGARKKGRMNWLDLYISRITRLFPLYLFAVFMVLLIALVLGDFVIRDSAWKLALNITRWLLFSISGAPNFNQIQDTWIIIAGVTWSLAYEWLFYASLPFGALFFGLKPSMKSLASSSILCLIIIFTIPQLNPLYIIVFAVGAIAAIVSKSPRACNIFSGPLGSLLALVSIIGAVAIFPGKISPASIALAGLCFTIIACGNTLFGILTWPSVRMLGDISYSVYLIHGIVLFIAFTTIGKYSNAMYFSVIQHWLFISILTVILVGLSYLTYRFIEWPAMRSTPQIQARIRAALSSL